MDIWWTALQAGTGLAARSCKLSLEGAAISIIFAATKICLSRQMFCRDKHTFVATKYVFVVFVATNKIVATKMILVAAPANDSKRRTFGGLPCRQEQNWLHRSTVRFDKKKKLKPHDDRVRRLHEAAASGLELV